MHSMNYLGKFISNFRYVYNEINAATLTGAIDVVVVEQPDGTFTCSPFHVRFGKIGVLRSREKVVDIEINGEPVDIHMKLGESGEAFFVEEVSADELGDDFIPPHLTCSPIPREGSFHERYLMKDSNIVENIHWNQERFDGGETKEERLKIEGELELSSTPKVVVAGGGSVVKTFKAETVEQETACKLSAASTEFKPITKEGALERESDGSSESIPSKGISAIDLNKDDDSPLSERVSTSLPGNKRKRRKRSLLKKKTNNGPQRRNSNIELTTDVSVEPRKEQAEFESIFQIEDLDQKPTTRAHEELQDNGNSEELAHIKDAPVETDIHFFSDTELTPGCSPHDNRQFTPVQSDTEFETKRGISEGDECKVGEQSHQQSWRWGELPTSSLEEASKEDAQRSMLHNMLGFMKKTKHIRHNPQSQAEGIYLSDINVEELDPEVAALYFPTNYKQVHPSTESKNGKDEDAESGNGPSLPHSPHSVEGAIGGPKSVDSDFEEAKKLYGEISMSLCGGLTTTTNPSEEAFLHHIITYDEFVANPTLINNPNLIIRIDGKMYNWRTASPIILTLAAFQKPLPQEVITRLCVEFTPTGVSVTDQRRPRRGYSSWFTWGARAPQQAESGSGNTLESQLPEQRQSSDQTAADSAATSSPSEQHAKDDTESENVSRETEEFAEETMFTVPEERYQCSNSSDSDSENERKRLKSQNLKIPLSREARLGSDKFRKTLRLTSEQIASLNLRNGANEIEFSVTTAYQGTSRCKCFLFKWRYDDKIVVSDIDGTITKSDVLGHILPIVGKDWAQSGVAKLFTKIKDNGYKLLYLSARAIGQSRLTRDYLKSVKQEDLSLPEGPMLLNPTSLLNALHTEVIEKKPEEFKISCLRDIQALFPPNSQPFYAGYGNKINDVWAYQAVGIPIVRIFTINHRGELKHELTQTFQSSYSNMTYIVDQMFPTKQDGGTLLEDFSQFVYWREPIPEMDLTLSSIL